MQPSRLVPYTNKSIVYIENFKHILKDSKILSKNVRDDSRKSVTHITRYTIKQQLIKLGVQEIRVSMVREMGMPNGIIQC